jgi:uncharacterized protein (UPF0335 family)
VDRPARLRQLSRAGKYAAIIEDVERERRSVADRIEDLTRRIEALAPDTKAIDRLLRMFEDDVCRHARRDQRATQAVAPAVVVSKEEITVEPWRGTTWVYDRTPRSRSA